jgi:hypothetical protein
MTAHGPEGHSGGGLFDHRVGERNLVDRARRTCTAESPATNIAGVSFDGTSLCRTGYFRNWTPHGPTRFSDV